MSNTVRVCVCVRDGVFPHGFQSMFRCVRCDWEWVNDKCGVTCGSLIGHWGWRSFVNDAPADIELQEIWDCREWDHLNEPQTPITNSWGKGSNIYIYIKTKFKQADSLKQIKLSQLMNKPINSKELDFQIIFPTFLNYFQHWHCNWK